MKIDQIREQVRKDFELDETELDRESMRVPQLHNKYLNMLFDEKLLLKQQKAEHAKLRRLKWEYYSGKLDEDQLDELGWEQFDLKILRNDLDKYLESDEELVNQELKTSFQKEKVHYLESVIKNIANLQWNIRNAIEWHKFKGGEPTKG